jgi:hypothetical protein
MVILKLVQPCEDKDCHDNLLQHKINLIKVFVAWLYFEQVFMSLVDKELRANNTYCTMYNSIDQCKNIEMKCDTVDCILKYKKEGDEYRRYVSANLQNLKKEGTGTIEIRIKQGSNDIMGQNVMWIKLLGLFFSAAYHAPCIEKGKQCGSEALDELFSFIKIYHKKEYYSSVIKYWNPRS